MAKSGKETVVLLVTLLTTAGVATGGWYLYNKANVTNPTSSPQPESPLSSTSTSSPQPESPISSAPQGEIADRISSGQKILVQADTNPNKQEGVGALANSDFPKAIAKLIESLQTNRNDPEALIYLNNAKIGSKNWVEIAVSVPIATNLNVAKEILRGVAQAQDEVNQSGGISSYPLKVTIASDDNNLEIVKQVASEFVKNTRIMAVVGHNSSDASLAAAPIYQAGGLVMISPTSNAKALSGIGSYIFRTVPSIRFEADALSRYAIKYANRKNIGICVSSASQSSQSLKEDFTAAVFVDGGKISPISCDLSSPNFDPNSAIAEMVTDRVDGLLLAPGVDNIAKGIEVAAVARGKFLLLSSSTMYTFKTLQLGQANVDGMVLTVPWHPNAIVGSSFPANAIKLWGGDVSWRSAMAYDATQAIVAGLRYSSSRDALREFLASPGFSVDGASGKIQFQPSGDRNSPPILVKIFPGNRSGVSYDFLPIPKSELP